MKLMSVVLALTMLLAQLVPSMASACPNDSHYSDDIKSCTTFCACGTSPETCGCCSTNCHDHGWNSSPSSTSGSGSSSSSGGSSSGGSSGGSGGGESFTISGPVLAVIIGIALGAVIIIWETEKSSKGSSGTSASIGPARGLGFSF